MENNYENLRMLELKALARERRLRGYSRLRKAELIAFLQNDRRNNELRREMRVEPPSGAVATWELEPTKIRSMKRELGKIIGKLKESEKSLESIESRIPKKSTKQHPTNTNKCKS